MYVLKRAYFMVVVDSTAWNKCAIDRHVSIVTLESKIMGGYNAADEVGVGHRLRRKRLGEEITFESVYK